MSLRSITTEVLTVLNATEDLLQGVEEGDYACSPPYTPSLPLNTDTKRLDEQLSRLEENVRPVCLCVCITFNTQCLWKVF